MLYLEFQALLHQTQLVYSTWDCLLWFCDTENTVGSEQRVDPGTPRIEGLSALLPWPEELQPTGYETRSNYQQTNQNLVYIRLIALSTIF